MAFFKRVHITAEQQIENPRVVSEIQDAVIAEAIEAGHSHTSDKFFGSWWKQNKGFNGFKTVRAAKAVHTAFDKRECGDDPNLFLFISVTWEDVEGTGRCFEEWTSMDTVQTPTDEAG